MSVLQLCELYDDLEALCREYSEALVSELALRDELEYDKELRNQFITLFLSIQRKKRAHSARKKQNRKGGSGTQELSTAEKVYLTTTIPYNNTHSPPSSELLATYVKILKAMDNESPNLPMLLTEYILKGCLVG
ncbi:hypothetical protein HELRODRAFT_85523 [Helobdella robusta]|uniref:Uncharacterized protein n=1 Tax=Helobdella robusta TaxID=6412 RepID=T1G5Y5_HELRO|nr:hypothetical protein HELRODRAFT_85523 [Helobdella robusta]ESN97428.1 hypothetical protein HELRODRAFT_85523 [Helobdella robusta]